MRYERMLPQNHQVFNLVNSPVEQLEYQIQSNPSVFTTPISKNAPSPVFVFAEHAGRVSGERFSDVVACLARNVSPNLARNVMKRALALGNIDGVSLALHKKELNMDAEDMDHLADIFVLGLSVAKANGREINEPAAGVLIENFVENGVDVDRVRHGQYSSLLEKAVAHGTPHSVYACVRAYLLKTSGNWMKWLSNWRLKSEISWAKRNNRQEAAKAILVAIEEQACDIPPSIGASGGGAGGRL